MNAGFSNFDTLKKHLLGGGTVKNDTRFDAVIQAIGPGVAAQFEKFCNRRFQRANATEVFPADRVNFVVSRYPVESVTQWELKSSQTDGFVVQNLTQIVNVDGDSGVIQFAPGGDLGRSWQQVRFTFTGGYFWNTLEPDDAAFPETLPAGATALPESLRLAWLLQCKHVWKHQDKLGTDVLTNGDEKSLRFPEDFAGTVEKTLGQFTRLNLV